MLAGCANISTGTGDEQANENSTAKPTEQRCDDDVSVPETAAQSAELSVKNYDSARRAVEIEIFFVGDSSVSATANPTTPEADRPCSAVSILDESEPVDPDDRASLSSVPLYDELNTYWVEIVVDEAVHEFVYELDGSLWQNGKFSVTVDTDSDVTMRFSAP